MAARYIPSNTGFVEPVEEPDWGEEPPSDDLLAPSELSVAPSGTGAAMMHSAPRPGMPGKGGPPPLPGQAAPAMGGFSEHELASYALDDEDDWGSGGGQAAHAPQQQQHGTGNYGGGYGGNYGGYAGGGTHGGALPPAPAQQQAGGYGGGGAFASAADDEYMCPNCPGTACSRRTSNTQKNPGRVFYKCAQCNLFKWADEVGAAGGGGGGIGGGSGYSPVNKRRITSYGSQKDEGGYQPGFGGYGGGGGGPPPVPGSNTFQAAADGGALRDRSNDVCYKCHGVGHWASKCPNQGEGGGGYGGGGGGGFAGSRYKADGGGGSTWGGAQGGGGAYGGAAGGKSGACFKCGDTTHWASKCPNQGGGGGGSFGGGGYGGGGGGNFGGGGGKNNGCFKCGDPSHWGKDCPNNDGGGVRGYGGGGAGKRKWDGGGGGGYGKGW